ncbi:MAG: UDP-N-acetylmuramate dehydrogenase [Proteiniphilum sp.]|nr:UDP-N-acetylmuramate dehydrogenase [Proteiniphilum sp.]MDD4158415.1 UDP-N-acetylmuramate dehydrogenase [Proteiniphilum sp.]MDD4800512.1 UDP-N-acetylmuramate dehydrogenase [Proteiniphilum sp.]
MHIQHHIQLRPYNSFRTKAVARLFCEPQSVEELTEILKRYPTEKKLILGGGCNLFFTEDFEGLVIRPAIKGIELIRETEQEVEVEAGAAEEWDRFVDQCVSKGFSGVENLSLIPGSMGASPVQNIGAYGTEVKDTIVLVKTVDMQTGEPKAFTAGQCGFSYRDSLFKRSRRYIITSVRFRLQKSFTYREKYADLSRELSGIATPTLTQVREAIIRIRTRKLPDPDLLPNAGSFFKNPVLPLEAKDVLLKTLPDLPLFPAGENRWKTSAAYLIEKAGYKGKRKGMVGISGDHALIIVNYGTDNGKEIVAFMKEVQNEVFRQCGVMLEPEVWIF